MLLLVALLPNPYRHPIDGLSVTRWISIPAALFYVANMIQALGHPLGYLGHTWSLSIEEQFYFLWPAVALWLAVTRRLRTWLPALIAAAAVSRVLMALVGVPTVVGWLPAEADQLLIGAALAVALLDGRLGFLRHPAWGWAALTLLAVLCLIGSATHQGSEGTVAIYGGLTLAGLATAALIGYFVVGGSSPLLKAFTLAPIVLLGRVSYGVYLFHFPVFQWVQHERWPSLGKTLVVVVSADGGGGSDLVVRHRATRAPA